VKKKHIEFHLGPGGQSQRPAKNNVYVPKSDYERQLEDKLKSASGSNKDYIEKQLYAERERRRKQERYEQSIADQQYQIALSARTPQEWARMAGSRINVRFDSRVPGKAQTPSGLVAALSRVIDFDPASPGQAVAAPPAAPVGASAPIAAAAPVRAPAAAAAPPAGPSVPPIRKGQSRSQVDAALGQPKGCSRDAQGTLPVETCSYRLSGATLEASFVDGVLVRYVITSQ
jgi:hypothetical protein